MPRPYSPLRVSDFVSYEDAPAITIDEAAASALENWYKIRKRLVRRKGQAYLGSGNLSPNQDLNGLFWAKIGSPNAPNEMLVGVHNTNVDDFFAASPGQTVAGGSARLTNNDCNAAWVQRNLYVGDGYSQNVYVTQNTGFAVSLTAASSQYLSVASNSTLQTGGTSFTVAAWVYCTSLGTYHTIMGKWTQVVATSEWRLKVDNAGNVSFSIMQGGAESAVAAGVTIGTNAWHFVVGWYDSVAGTIYVQLDNGTVASSSVAGGTTNTGTAFTIGADLQSGGANFFDGRIDEAAFWKRTLTTAERTTLYNAGAALSYGQVNSLSLTGSLISMWDLEESSGTRFDATATGNNLTPTGTPSRATGIAAVPTVFQAGQPPPATAPTVAAGGVGTFNGSYTFVVAFIGQNSYPGLPSPASTPITLTAQQANLTNIPTSPDPDCIARYIYALGGGFALYTLVDTVLDNTTTSRTINGSSITNNAFTHPSFSNTRFPPCRYLIEHQSRMIGAWCATADGDKQTVYVSNSFQPWYAPAAPDTTDPSQGTQATIQGPAGGEITGLCEHGGVVAIFTGGAGHLLLGTSAADFRTQKFADHGCVAHRTIKSTRHLLFWLSGDGVYMWNGLTVERISDMVRETIAGITASDMAQAHAFVWYDRYYLCWPHGCLYYDILNQMWGKLTNNTWRTSSVTVFTPGNLPRIYAAELGNARVVQLETGAADRTGAAIIAHWASRDWECGLPAHEKRVHLIESKWQLSTGIATIELIDGTGNIVQTISYDISTQDVPGATVSRQLTSAVEQARDENFRLDITIASLAADIELLGAGVYWTVAW